MARMTKRLRFEILRRDNHTCRYCGATAPNVALQVDHVTPTALGGTTTPDNLVTACVDCNSGKSSVPADAAVVDDVAQLAAEWARAIDRVVHARVADRGRTQADVDRFGSRWSDYWWTDRDGERHPIPIDGTWPSSVRVWLARGVQIEELLELIPVAMANTKIPTGRVWRYFCGAAWRVVADIETEAGQIIAWNAATHGESLMEV